MNREVTELFSIGRCSDVPEDYI